MSQAGWLVCDASQVNIHAARGVAIREFPLPGHGFADYLLSIDGKAAGVIEAKKEGATLTGVEIQADQYTKGYRGIFPVGTTRCRLPTSPPASRPASPTTSIPHTAFTPGVCFPQARNTRPLVRRGPHVRGV